PNRCSFSSVLFLIPVIVCCFCGCPTTTFQKSKKLTDKVEVRIVRHGPVTLRPQLGRLSSVPAGVPTSQAGSRGPYDKVRLDQAWSCGRDAHISIRCIRSRRCVGRSCLSAPTAPDPLCLLLDRILCRCSCRR